MRKLRVCSPRGLSAALLATALWPGSGYAHSSAASPVTPDIEIVVTADRSAVAGVAAERVLDQNAASAYGVDTIGELLDEITAESGESSEDAIFLINGQRVSSVDDIADFPVEAIAQVEVLPRGTGARVGAPSSRRVYNVRLRKEVRSKTSSISHRAATEGHWFARRGELIFTRINGMERLNISLRARDESRLLESQRRIVQPSAIIPYSVTGNIIASPRIGEEIDSRLSAIAGRVITTAGVPTGKSRPTLADFAVNDPNQTDVGRYRSLRPAGQSVDLSISAASPLSSWLRSTLTGRLSWNETASLQGLPQTLFVIPATNLASPFVNDVGMARYTSEEALRQKYRSLSGALSSSLNAQFGEWQVDLETRFDNADRQYTTDRTASGAVLLDEPSRNPFEDLSDLVPLRQDRAHSLSSEAFSRLSATAPVVKLPAGAVRITPGVSFSVSTLKAIDHKSTESPSRRFRRSEQSASVAGDLPISNRQTFLNALGDLSATFEVGRSRVSELGSTARHALGFVWSPIEAVRISGEISGDRRPADIELLAEPIISTPGVRYFDPVLRETTDVVQISGGNPDLLRQKSHTRRLSGNIRPVRHLSLQLSADYISTHVQNFLSSLPPASAAVLAAFPERFLRDADGRLSIVNVQAVNFARRSNQHLRYGFNLTVPIGTPQSIQPPSRMDNGSDTQSSEGSETLEPMIRVAGGPRPRVQLAVFHTWLLVNEVVIRRELPKVNLLGVGAIGIAGSRPRHQLDLTLGYAERGLGTRLSTVWRSKTFQAVGSGVSRDSSDTLEFSSFGMFNLRLFAESSRFAPKSQWLKNTRVTLSAANLFNERQQVTDSSGVTPLRYQPGYRDPVGRSLELQLRKQF